MIPEALMNRINDAKVVAGFSIEEVEHAVPLCRALLEGGISVIELTLRTDAGLAAVKEIATKVPEILLGVGTILTPEQARAVHAAGGHFGVAPGLNANVIREAAKVGLPFAPGIATPSELETALSLGCRWVKLFPAESLGGLGYLKAMAAPYAHLGVKYFPLGGINADNMQDYLARADVPAVGGSWIVKPDLVREGKWVEISARATDVVQRLSN
ncbi:bifunctional 4-hydroxy-2-oxoglutarate aldolase/2-dehydro-3-deoxy-phosphogluconate aldolase [Opitutaceae bacterium]|nr:bifunctional 4-hydroxy-2-oxoglutarate aldolase/2-dehydro-3-deoxy-phosphogluconate aldolase [Opitutaceae bacterium]